MAENCRVDDCQKRLLEAEIERLRIVIKTLRSEIDARPWVVPVIELDRGSPMSDVNTDQAIFDAIVVAVTSFGPGAFNIHTQKFIEAFNNHRDRALCTSLVIGDRTTPLESSQ